MKFLSALIPLFINALMTLIGKIIVAFGLTFVSYIGLDMIVNNFKTEIRELISYAPQGALQLFYLSGGGTVLNIIFGCFTFFVAFKSLTKLVPKGAK